MGHRDYIGGLWDEIGQLQFDFLLSNGLKPFNFLLDIACGSLRLGVKAIPYLDNGHYFGIDKEIGLIKAGLEKELNSTIIKKKQPRFVISDSFEFKKFGNKVDFVIAQSLFTHLPNHLINLCFINLYPWLKDDGIFWATFFETKKKICNPKKSHDHDFFAYTKNEMIEFGESNGYITRYIGDWNHPRKQMIVEYKKAINL